MLGDSLTRQGYRLVEYGEETDLLVLNTCSVTENAEKDCRYAVRKTLRHSPHAFVAVTGCYAQTGAAQLQTVPGIDLIVGTQALLPEVERARADGPATGPRGGDHLRRAHGGVGAHLGKPWAQNAKGHVLGHVKDMGLSSADPNVRIYQTAERQTFHCFGCDAHGGAVSFLMRLEHLTLPEAVQKLQGPLGVIEGARLRGLQPGLCLPLQLLLRGRGAAACAGRATECSAARRKFASRAD